MEVIEVIKQCSADENILRVPKIELSREDYLAVKKAIEKNGDKFVCRNGDIALYLWMNNKEGYSLQLVNEKKPQNYYVDGHWHSQSYKENAYEIVSKVDDKGVFENVLKDLQIAENEVLNEIRFCQEHKMGMEAAALRYKCKAFEQFRRIIYKNEED